MFMLLYHAKLPHLIQLFVLQLTSDIKIKKVSICFDDITVDLKW